MADLAPTLSLLEIGEEGVTCDLVQIGDVGIGQFEPIYYKTSDQKYWPAQNDGTEEEARAAYITITGCAAANGWVYAIESGLLDLGVGGGLTATETYVVSDTAGKIMPKSDLGSGEYYTPLGDAVSTTELDVNINPSGVQKA